MILTLHWTWKTGPLLQDLYFTKLPDGETQVVIATCHPASWADSLVASSFAPYQGETSNMRTKWVQWLNQDSMWPSFAASMDNRAHGQPLLCWRCLVMCIELTTSWTIDWTSLYIYNHWTIVNNWTSIMYELPIETSLILSTSATGTSLSTATPLGMQAQSGQKPFVIGPAIDFISGRLRP